jgi:chemotaxis protein methyltransferase CheR
VNLRSKEILDLIAIKTGLDIKGIDIGQVEKAVDLRVEDLKLSSPREYKLLLNSSSIQAKNEWNNFIPYLTKGESYFFRDKGHISLLKNEILPNLLKKTRIQKELRIWSAGCSTGEEPYTIAIMLDQLIPNWDHWKVHILGTDMTGTSIQKAKEGLFSNWSFRGMDSKIKKRYFEKYNDENWKIIERIQKKVTFNIGNLITDDFPSVMKNVHNLDLIICRNVFIYHKRESVLDVVKKFSNTLIDDGYLLVGHSELYDQEFDRLKIVSSKEGIFYQKTEDKKENHRNVKNKINWKDNLASKKEPQVFKTINLDKKNPKKTLNFKAGLDKKNASQNKPEKRNDQGFEKVFLEAQSSANKGDYDQALSHFKKAQELNSFKKELFYYWAHLEMGQNNIDQAKAHFKRAIYLDAAFVPAYFDLVNVYEMENDSARAEKMKQTALKLLRNMGKDVKIELLKNAKVSELIQYLERSS